MRIALALFVIFTLVASATAAGPMTPGERQRLVAHFEMTEAWLDDKVKNLSDARLEIQDDADELDVEEIVVRTRDCEPQYRNHKASLAKPRSPISSRKPPTLRYRVGFRSRPTHHHGEGRVPGERFPDMKSSSDLSRSCAPRR